MELKDFVVTPIVLFIVYILAYIIRPKVTDHTTKRYFIPALTVKVIGAISVGLIYQFYYGGGDTFAYHTHGSRIIWEAFIHNPLDGIKLLFANGKYYGSTFQYASQIWYYSDQSSYSVVRIAAIFDLLTFGSYSGTAVLFATFSFSGVWVLFLSFYHKFHSIHKWLALAILFIPTVFFWGSGILKDTITLGALGWLVYSFNEIFIKQKLSMGSFSIFILSLFLIYSIKLYILLAVLPSIFIWYYLEKVIRIKSTAWKILAAPVLLFFLFTLGFFAIREVGESDPRYKVTMLAETARITAYDIRFGWGARHGDNSGYYLGELDGSFLSMVKLFPAAVNVALFRPYLWEVRNPFMLLSAIESFMVLGLTVFVVCSVGPIKTLKFLTTPEIAFCLVFAIAFSFAVGISTYNFGTLSRYKLPMLPFYVTGILLIYHKSQNR